MATMKSIMVLRRRVPGDGSPRTANPRPLTSRRTAGLRHRLWRQLWVGRLQVATLVLVCANVAVYTAITFGGLAVAAPWVLSPVTQELVPGLVARGLADGAWWQPLTSAFVHLGWWHLAANVFVLWLLGQQIEYVLGPWRLAGLYVCGALAGSAVVLVLGRPDEIVVGASGALYAFFGLLVVWAIRRRANLGLLVAIVLLNAFVSVAFAQISWQAHLGGLLAGVVLGLALRPGRQRAAGRDLAVLGGLVLVSVVVSWARVLTS